MRLCFLAEDPVLVAHARRLGERHDVVIVAASRAHEAEHERFDVAVADGWRSSARLFEIPAERYVLHVAQIEHRVLPLSSPDRIPAALALDLPLDFTAESEGLADFLRALRPDARVAVVPPAAGAPAPAAERSPNGVLRLALAGDEEAGARTLSAMSEPHEQVDDHPDLVLAVGDPREPARVALSAYARGAALVMEAGPLADGLVEHRETGLLADPDDPDGTARLLDEAARDQALIERLRSGAARRLESWPGAEAAAAALESALTQFVAAPPPADTRWPARLMGDAIAHAAELKSALDATHGAIDLTNPLQTYVTRLEDQLEAIKRERAYRAAVGWRSRLRARFPKR
jgi:hypothetical protein